VSVPNARHKEQNDHPRLFSLLSFFFSRHTSTKAYAILFRFERTPKLIMSAKETSIQDAVDWILSSCGNGFTDADNKNLKSKNGAAKEKDNRCYGGPLSQLALQKLSLLCASLNSKLSKNGKGDCICKDPWSVGRSSTCSRNH
jgi:hypothetical protein